MIRFHHAVGRPIRLATLLACGLLAFPAPANAQSSGAQVNVTYRHDDVHWYADGGGGSFPIRYVDVRGNYTLRDTSTVRERVGYARIYFIGLGETSNSFQYLDQRTGTVNGNWSTVLEYPRLAAYRVEFGIDVYRKVGTKWVYSYSYTVSSRRYSWGDGTGR